MMLSQITPLVMSDSNQLGSHQTNFGVFTKKIAIDFLDQGEDFSHGDFDWHLSI